MRQRSQRPVAPRIFGSYLPAIRTAATYDDSGIPLSAKCPAHANA